MIKQTLLTFAIAGALVAPAVAAPHHDGNGNRGGGHQTSQHAGNYGNRGGNAHHGGTYNRGGNYSHNGNYGNRGGNYGNRGGNYGSRGGSYYVARARMAPPPMRREYRPARPHAGYVWQPGYWQWNDDQYVWFAGQWAMPPWAGAQWMAPSWQLSDGIYIMIGGRWF